MIFHIGDKIRIKTEIKSVPEDTQERAEVPKSLSSRSSAFRNCVARNSISDEDPPDGVSERTPQMS